MRKSIFLIISFLLIPAIAFSAIVVEGTWTSGAIDETAVSSSTISVTVPSISNGLLVAKVGLTDNTGAGFLTSGITFNTTENFTLVRGDESASGGSEPRTEIWYLKAPTATTADVILTYGQNMNVACVSLILLSGVDQTNTVDAQAGAADINGDNPETLAITTVADGAMITSVQAWKDPETLTQGTGQT